MLPIPEPAEGTWQQIVLSPANGGLRGVVVDEAGKPLPNVQLQLADDKGHWFVPPQLARKHGEPDGSFEFEGLPARNAWLLVRAPGCAARGLAVDTRQAAPLRLEMRRGRHIAIAIAMPDGIDASCAVVRDSSGRPLQDDRLSGTKCYGELSVIADLDAATIAVFDGATGKLVGEGSVPASGSLLRLQR